MAEETLRETLEKSAAKVEEAAAGQADQGTTAGAGTVGEANAAAAAEVDKTPPQEGADKKPPQEDTNKTPPQEGQDKKAPAEGADKKPPQEGQDKKPPQEGADKKIQQKPEFKGVRPPESWKPAIRDKHWKTLPLEVQTEIIRRERQVDEALQESAGARKGIEQVNQVLGQYKDLFDFEKAPPLQTVASTLNMMRALRFAQPAQKAQVLAQMVSGFDVDVKLLDQALSMIVKPSDPAAQARMQESASIRGLIQSELAPLREMMKSVSAQRENEQVQEQTAMRAEIQAFADDEKNVYFPIVADTMADIMEAGAARGQKITLQDAYKRAILAHNDLAEQYTQDQLKQASQKLSAPAEAARKKALQSVTGSISTAPPAPAGQSLREDLEAAAALHSGRM